MVLSFYDLTSIQIPDGYNRDIYIRITYQKKLDGRNYSMCNENGPYNLRAGFSFINQTHETIECTSNGSGSDIWYTVYLQYSFINAGKQTQLITTAEDYWTIKNILMRVEYYRHYPQEISFEFSAHRTDGDSGFFIYEDNGTFSTRLIPELPMN